MRVLVTDGDTRAALAVTRSLGRIGHDVHVSAPAKLSLAGSSRYATENHRQADLAAGPVALERSLIRLFAEIDPDLVFGVTDRTLTVLHGLSAPLPPGTLPPPSAELYAGASDKVRLFETCLETGIAVPEGVVVDGGALPPSEAVEALGQPVVVRPALSWRVDQGRWVQGRVSYEPDLASIASRQRADHALSFPYLVQRKVEGEGCGLFLLAENGTILRTFAHRRLREKPPSGGVSTLCETVAPPADLAAAAGRLVEALRWSGLAMMEFKRARMGGEPLLLEVNARPWGSMALAIASGVDFPAEWIAMARQRTPPGRTGYEEHVRLRWWWGDVDHFFLREKAAGRSGAQAVLRALGRAVAAGPWPEAWDTFRRDDPVPFLVETSLWLSN